MGGARIRHIFQVRLLVALSVDDALHVLLGTEHAFSFRATQVTTMLVM
jgi:hypothetical protein